MKQARDRDIGPEDGLAPESNSAPLPSQSSARSMHVSFLQVLNIRTLPSLKQPHSCEVVNPLQLVCAEISDRSKSVPLQYDVSRFFI